MPWYITDGVLQSANSAPTANSILTDISIPMRKVVIPEGVTSIGNSAFTWAQSLTGIVLPSTLTDIGAKAFWGCHKLASVVLPDGLVSIGRNAFMGCAGLTRIVIPKNVTEIGDTAFYDCKNLTSVVLPECAAEIGVSVFEDCIRLTDISIPKGITSIPKKMFNGCSSLLDITLPDSITTIEDEAFRRCLSLQSIIIPHGVTSIGYEAFYGCCELTNVSIPDSVTSIGEAAFIGCDKLQSITIPNSVGSLGKDLFLFCQSLTSIRLPGNLISALDKQLRSQLTEIFCTANVSKVPPALRPLTFITFAQHEAEYSDQLRAEHFAAIKRSAAKLTEAACACPELLHLMCREKLISAKDIDAFIEEVTRREAIEATAVLLDYQANVLTMKAVFKARDRKEKAIKRQDDLMISRIEARADKIGINGLNFVVTGRLQYFKKHADLKSFITDRGGKLLSSMGANADYLITNDTDTGSAKNTKAAELGIIVISEDEFMKMAEETM